MVEYLQDCIFDVSELDKFGPEIRGHGNACSFNNELMFTTFHIRGDDRYLIGYYLFEKKYPFKPIYYCKNFILDSNSYVDFNDKRGNFNGTCIFPGGACDNGDAIILSIGVNDKENHFIEYDKKWLYNNVNYFKNYNPMKEYSKNILAINKFEINLTNKCDKKCYNCHQLCDIDKFKENDLDFSKIILFIEEIKRKNVILEKIGLIGGEPSLYYKILDVIDEVLKYSSSNNKTKIVFYTNGGEAYNIIKQELFAKGFREVDEFIGYRYSIVNSLKNNGYNHCVYYFNNPKDFNLSTNIVYKNCDDSLICGMTISNRGIFPCQKSYTMSRIKNENSIIQNLDDLNENSISEMIFRYCDKCGNNIKFGKERFSDYWKKYI
jgi:hypothetical protein